MRLYDYAASGNCFKVRLLVSLLNLEVDCVPVDIFAGDTLTDEFARLNPARETPVLELDDGETVTQSNAILWLLAEGTRFLPAPALERARVVEWLGFEQEWVMRGIGGGRFRLVTGHGAAEAARRLDDGRRALDILDAALADRPFVVGEHPTIADVSLFAYTHVAPDAGLALERWPNVRAWVHRVEALPGYMNDLTPYPENARAGHGRSIYEPASSAQRSL